MRVPRRALIVVLAGILVVAVAGTRAATNSRDKQEVARMTKKMKTVCVGRLLIDLPEETELYLRSARIHGFAIDAYAESTDEFRARLEEREAQLRATPDRHGGDMNLEVIRELRTKAGLLGKMFVHSREVTEGTAANGQEIETYRYENVALEALVHANGLSIDIVSPKYNPASIENLPILVSQLVPNPDNQIPREPGYCIDRAYVRDPLTPKQREQITMSGRIATRPDVEFKLILAAGIRPAAESLLERSDDSSLLALMDIGRIARLRAAPRSIAGIEGDELVQRFVEENDAVVYNFSWEVDGKVDNVFFPHILFMMDTGKSDKGPIPSSLSEGAATGLWDTITSSIRFRPTEVTSKVVVRPEVPPPQTWWEKLRGPQPSYETKTPTAWKLQGKRSRKRIAPAVQLAAAASAAPPATLATANSCVAVPQAPVPLGSYASTGSPCPASGWWRNEEPQSLDGTRWFALGSVLPPASFAVKSMAFGRAGSAPKVIRRRGAWQLVRHADTESLRADQLAA
jgi:hypothetical protein